MKLYRKIDLYFAGDYVCSTAQARTCRDARLKYIASIKLRSHSLGGIGDYDPESPGEYYVERICAWEI